MRQLIAPPATGADYPVFALDKSAFRAFCAALAIDYPSGCPTMDHFREPEFRNAYLLAAEEMFGEEILRIHATLENDLYGLAVIDVPQLEGTLESNAQILGFACATAIFSTLANAKLVPPNNVPFGLHVARTTLRKNEDGSDPLRYTPDVEFGFHTDGITSAGSLYVPNTIGIYNLLLTYENPGHFHWLPYSRWPEFSKYLEMDELSRAIEIEIPPAAYLGRDGKEIVGGTRFVDVPIVKKSGDSRRPVFFFNGALVNPDGGEARVAEALRQMRSSLSTCGAHFDVPQRERRLIIVKNSRGFHSRDQLLRPLPDCQISRVFARFIDANGEVFGPINTWGASPVAEQ